MFVANATRNVASRPRRAGRVLALAGGLAALALTTTVPAPAFAWGRLPSVDREFTAGQGPLAVGVKVTGRSTPLFQASNRPDRWYIEAREGANYQVTVRNTSGERVAFVIAVDGLNAINGLRSHLGADEPMYVLDPYQSATIKGWRKDLGNVSKFVFVDEERSYAARTDQANGDLGWIRVVAFHEVRPVAWGSRMNLYRDGGGSEQGAPSAPPAPEARDEMSKDAPRAKAQRADGNTLESAPSRSLEPLAEKESSPGTGWGGNQRDRVREVEFTPERNACAQVILRYEYHAALVSLGILPWRGYDRDRLWERENGQLGFAPPPTR
jgi:hypothetical protein